MFCIQRCVFVSWADVYLSLSSVITSVHVRFSINQLACKSVQPKIQQLFVLLHLFRANISQSVCNLYQFDYNVFLNMNIIEQWIYFSAENNITNHMLVSKYNIKHFASIFKVLTIQSWLVKKHCKQLNLFEHQFKVVVIQFNWLFTSIDRKLHLRQLSQI